MKIVCAHCGSPPRPFPGEPPCPECDGQPVRCFWKLTPQCGRLADRLLEGEPSCAHCAATSLLDEIADEVARERGITITEGAA